MLDGCIWMGVSVGCDHVIQHLCLISAFASVPIVRYRPTSSAGVMGSIPGHSIFEEIAFILVITH